jgi:tRNA A-37 threonylcarbamoyl transferase component Bud32
MTVRESAAPNCRTDVLIRPGSDRTDEDIRPTNEEPSNVIFIFPLASDPIPCIMMLAGWEAPSLRIFSSPVARRASENRLWTAPAMPTYAQNVNPDPTRPPGSDSTRGPSPADSAPVAAADVQPITEASPEASTSQPQLLDVRAPVLASLGKYELLEKVAVGGMGVIYRARDTILERIVALKMIRTGLLAQPAEIERFYTEARAVAQLKHRNIIPIHDIAEHAGQHFFTMDFAVQGSVAKQRERYAENPRETVVLVRKVARAVHHAHEHNILHRDLKPSNILLDEHDEPLVSDFGLAKFLGADIEQTEDGQPIGTPAYMSPEQAAGRSERISPRTDVWALGVVLYELLTGQRPFLAKTREEITRLILDSDPAPPRKLQPLLDRDLEKIILKCLEKEPSDRYASAEALAADLDRWLGGETPLAHPVSWPTRTWRRVRRAFVPIAAAVCVLLLTVFIIEVVRALTPATTFSPAEQAARRRRQEIRRALADGKEVVLVGSHGAEVTYPWKSDAAHYVISEKANMPLRLDTHALALFVLHPDPELARYRLEAEIRLPSQGIQEFGIFFGYDSQPSRNGKEHWLNRFTVIEQTPFRSFVSLDQHLVVYDEALASGSKNLTHALHRRPWVSPTVAASVAGYGGTPFGRGGFQVAAPALAAANLRASASLRSYPWHRMAVETGPDEVRAYWEGVLFARVSADRQDKTARSQIHRLGISNNLEILNPPPFALTPRGGLGLYVMRGQAEFRNVMLKPVPAP